MGQTPGVTAPLSDRPGDEAAGPSAAAEGPLRLDGQTPLQAAIVRYRWVGYGLIGLTFLLAFNGQWRIGSDTALYRALGHSLATGAGYTFRGLPHDHAFPGLPMILAGMEMAFGSSPIPFLLLNVGFAIGILVLVYHLIAFEAQRWVAVAVVLMVGLNHYFQTLTAEMLTDIPFLFATCLALWSHQRLRAARGWRRCVPLAAILLASLTMAAFLRPAIYIVLLALAIAWVWRLITRPSRRDAIILACVVLSVAAWIAFDLRGNTPTPLAGHDEHRTISRLSHPVALGHHVLTNLKRLANENLTDIFFSIDFGVEMFNMVMASVILVSSVLLVRRHRLWGLMVLVTLVVTVTVIKTAPRYYVMVLPLMAVGWVVMWSDLAQRLRRQHYDLVVGGALALVLVTNFGMNFKLIVNQRSEPFYETYQDGSYLPTLEMARQIRRETPPDAVILGPRARELTYLSGRSVWDGDDLRKRGHGILSKGVVDDMEITHAIFPAEQYKERWPLTYRLIATGYLSPGSPRESDRHPWWLAPARWLGQEPGRHEPQSATASAPRGLDPTP